MSKNFAAAFAAIIALAGFAGPVFAGGEANQQRSDPKFLGIDLDNRTVYYNGRNTGNFCIYRTIPVYNPYTGYFEYRRFRRCGQTKPNIVVMSEDADEDTVPRGNRIFNRVIRELAEVMNVHGYNVYDETAVAMGFTQPGRVRRRDTEIIDVARAVQAPPLDVIAVFQIYASATKSTVSDIVRPNIRIPGRLLNVRTGQQIATFEVAGLELAPLPQGCDRECLLERVGGEAKLVANELAQALTTKLSGFILPARGAGAVSEPTPPLSGGVTALVPGGGDGRGCANLPTAFVIRLNGFSTGEIQAIEEYLRAFGCYLHHRPIRATVSQTEYWYETRADSARLNRNMRLMLEHMNAAGQVSFAGNTFNITKLATR